MWGEGMGLMMNGLWSVLFLFFTVDRFFFRRDDLNDPYRRPHVLTTGQATLKQTEGNSRSIKQKL